MKRIALAGIICAGIVFSSLGTAVASEEIEIIHSFLMDSNPGWQTEGQWAFGRPQGTGGDPASGFTGSNVYGYNLAGSYPNNMPQYWLTTPALDCTGYTNIVLKFQRWLGSEHGSLDHADIEVSNDGSTWQKVWTLSGSLSDSSWQEVSYNISAVADDASAVYLRWGMGTTDGSVTYSGWNIDDVEIIGEKTDPLRITPSTDLELEVFEGNTFAPTNQVYTLINTSTSNLVWTANVAAPWVTLSLTGGTLSAGDSTSVTASIDSTVGPLPVSTEVAEIVFSNVTSGNQRSRNVVLITSTRPPPRQEFQVMGLYGTGSRVVDHNALTGDDRGGIAMGSSMVMCTGDNSTARYQNNRLIGGMRLNVIYDALVSDLRTGQIYSLANGTTPLPRGGGVATTLVFHNPVSGMATSETLQLSEPIVVGDGTGIFAGYGYMLLHTGSQAYSVSLDTGAVENLGPVSSFTHRSAENWAYWGIAEWYGGINYFVYVQDATTIARTAAVPGGATTTLATFSNLSDMASITASPDLNRWYFHHEGSSQFGGSSETLGYADAEFYIGSADGLSLEPAGDLSFIGWERGPFPQSGTRYTLENITASNIMWNVSSTAPWITILPAEGELRPDQFVELSIFPTNAAALSPGIYSDTLVFSNATSGVIQTRNVELTVQERLMDHFVWDPIGSTQRVTTVFNVAVTAVDQTGALFADYTNSVVLSGSVGGVVTSNSLLQETSYNNSWSGGDRVRGLRFTPTNDISITHVRRIFGEKVAIWTDTGTLLAEKSVSGPSGIWVEAPLDSPLNLTAGESYRIGAYLSTSAEYYADDGGTPTVFPHGTLDFGCSVNGGYLAPLNDSQSRKYLVDMRYSVGANQSITISPTNTGSFVAGVWSGSVTVLEGATNMVLRADDGDGHTGDSNPFHVEPLMLSVHLPEATGEGDSSITGEVTANIAPASNLVVHLVSEDLSEVTVESSVMIPAGQTNATFALQAADDGDVDGTQSAIITASATNYVSGSSAISVNDNETATLTLSLPETTIEGAGSIAGVVRVEPAPVSDVVVELVSNNPYEISNSSMVIPAGQDFVNILLPVVDDNRIDGVQTATVEAQVRNWTSGRDSIFVFDNETSAITLELPASAVEGDGVLTNAGRIVLSGVAVTDVRVALSLSDSSEIAVPASVTVPAGQSEVTFNVVVIDDAETDSLQQITVTAQSVGYIPTSLSMTVQDNDVHHFEVSSLSGSFAVLEPVQVNMTAKTIDGMTAMDFYGAVSLSASGDNGNVPITLNNSINFIGGAWSGDVIFGEVANNVILTADDGAGHSGTSSVFNVLGSLIVITSDSLIDTLVVADETLVRTMVISNAGNAELEFVIQREISDAGGEEEQDSSLIAHYSFDGNADDASGNGHDGIEVGSLSYSMNGISGTAAVFNGTDAKIQVPHADDLNLDGRFAISLWVKSTGTNPYSGLVSKIIPNNPRYGYSLNVPANIQMGVYNDYPVTFGAVYSTISVTDGSWHHLVATYDSDMLSLYIDGQLNVEMEYAEGLTTNSMPLYIGWDTSAQNRLFNGELDELRIYNRTLSLSEITDLYSEGGYGGDEEQDPNLVAYLPFNGNTIDESGNGHDGIVNGASLSVDRFGNAHSAYDFDGTDDFIELEIESGFDFEHTDAFSQSFWIRTEDAGSDPKIIFSKLSAFEEGYVSYLMENQLIFFLSDGSNYIVVQLPQALSDNQWYHIAIAYDGSSQTEGITIYVDGSLATTLPIINDVISGSILNDAVPTVGAFSDFLFFNGGIDDFRIYNRVLSESEVTELYTESDSGGGGGEPGLVARFPFNGNADDETGYGHNGIVSGATLTSDRFGNDDSAYSFDGIDAHIVVPDSGAFTVSDVSVAAWIRTTDKSDHKHITSCFGTEFRSQWYGLNIRNESGMAAWQVDPGGSYNPPTAESAMDVTDGTWHFVVGVRDTATAEVHIYVDGVLEGTSSDVSTDPLNPDVNFWIGGQNSFPSRFFNGDIDDVSIYSRILSASEIMDLYLEADPIPAWLKIAPKSGTVAPGSSVAVNMSFDAVGMVAGDYSNANFLVTCNDVFTPSNAVSASMWVLPPAPVMMPEPEVTLGTSNTVNWGWVEGPVEYLAEVLADTNSTPLQQSGWLVDTNHAFANLGTNTVYYYHVRASVATGIGRLDGPWSHWVQSRQVVDRDEIDVDADLIPDWWEQLYFDGFVNCDPLADSDGDGLNNRDEFIAGMDPTNSASCFRVGTVNASGGDAFILHWESATGRVYSVYWKTNMPAAFQALETDIRHPQNSYTDRVHNAESQGFYRIGVEVE